MLEKIKEYKSRIITFALSLWPAFRIFLRWPMLAVGLAAIPVQQAVEKKVNIGPVTSRIISVFIFAACLWISFYFAEAIIILCAVAFVAEIFIIWDKIKQAFRKETDLELAVA